MFYFSEPPAGLAALPHSGRMTPGSRRRQGQMLCFPGCFSAKGLLLCGVTWMLLLLFLLAFTLAVKPDFFSREMVVWGLTCITNEVAAERDGFIKAMSGI